MNGRSIGINNGKIWDGESFYLGNLLIDPERGIVEEISGRPFEADWCFDAQGCIVSAGLVDAHTHLLGISTSRFGMPAEMACLPFGVTHCADAGAEFGSREVLEAMNLDVCVFACSTIRGNAADLGRLESLLEKYGDRAAGVKVYMDSTVSDVRDAAPLKAICEFARGRGLRTVVHSSHSPVPMAELVDILAPGDILTHIYHGGEHSALEDHFSSLRRAEEKGIVLDSGNAGGVHTDVRVLQEAAEAGIFPITISSDITRLSAYVRGGVYGLPLCMSLFRGLGMSEEAVFRAVTSSAGSALGYPMWGALKAGGRADIAVMCEGEKRFELENRGGRALHFQKGYRCRLTIRGGQVVYRAE